MPDALPSRSSFFTSRRGKILEMIELSKTPQWAKALVAAAIKVSK
jgi:hypothetical protein